MSAKHRSKFAAMSPVLVTAAGSLKNCSCGYKIIEFEVRMSNAMYTGHLSNIFYPLRKEVMLKIPIYPLQKFGVSRGILVSIAHSRSCFQEEGIGYSFNIE
jgi:hypothetical protein